MGVYEDLGILEFMRCIRLEALPTLNPKPLRIGAARCEWSDFRASLDFEEPTRLHFRKYGHKFRV